MSDQSHLDQKYFIDPTIYNCPFCKRRHVSYTNKGSIAFDWSNDKKCAIWLIKCDSCGKTSMHLTFEALNDSTYSSARFRKDVDLDSLIFYSVPTSFFAIDSRIPKILRELISEAEGCVKMNFLTGASACTRKAIYELTVMEKAQGDHYEDKIKYLKVAYPAVDSDLFDILCHIKDMTSDKVHEQSWDKWDAKHLTLFLETLKAILHEIFVVPAEKRKRSDAIKSLMPPVIEHKKGKSS